MGVNKVTSVVRDRVKVLDSAGNVIEPRKENGHGSSAANPTHISNRQPASEHRYASRADADTFGTAVTSPHFNQFEVQFFKDAPENLMDVVKNATATTARVQGLGHFNLGVATTASLVAQTYDAMSYYSMHEIRPGWTAAWTTPPTGASDIALVEFGDGNDGYAIGYKGTAWGIRYMRNGVEVSFIPASSFSGGNILTAGNNEFTRNDTPEALNTAKVNIYRIRFGWLSGAPTRFEILAPDGHWAVLHELKHPNLNDSGQITTPLLPVRVIMSKTSSDNTNVEIRMGCISGGMVANVGVGQQPDGDIVPTKADGQGAILNTPLVANGSDETPIVDTDGWRVAELFVASDVIGTITVEYFNDAQLGGTPHASRTFTYSATDVSRGFRVIPLKTLLDGMRVRYTNGITGQTSFLLVLTLRVSPSDVPQAQLGTTISLDDDAAVIQGPILARNGDNTYYEIGRDGTGHALSVHVAGQSAAVQSKPLDTAAEPRQFVVGSVPVRLDPVPLTGRIVVGIMAIGTSKWAYGHGSDITFLAKSNQRLGNFYQSLRLSEAVQLWAICEQTTGGQVTQNVNGASTSGTATSTANALTSNSVRALITAAAQTLNVTGFTYTPTASSTIQSVRIGVKGRKEPNKTQVATFAEVQTGTTTGSGSVNSGTLAGGSAMFYLAAISRNTQTGTVNAVTGLGLTWTALIQNVSNGSDRLDIWYATGTATSGVVSASLSVSTNAHISVHRYTGVHQTTPVSVSGTSTGTGTTATGPSLSGVVNGIAYLGVVHNEPNGAAGAGYTERSDLTVGTGSNTNSLATEGKQLSSTASEAGTYTFVGSTAWAVAQVILAPASAIDPVVTVSYETPSGTPGITSGTLTFNSETDITLYLDVSSDKVWVESNIDNFVAKLVGTTIGTAAAEIDHVFVEVVDTTGNTIRISVEQYKGAA